VLIVRKLIVWAFMYSLDGLLADEGTDYWRYCFSLPEDPTATEQKIAVYQSAYAHLMGRTTYEGMFASLATTDHTFSPIVNPARKVVFSRTLKSVDWQNTTIAAGDTATEIEMLRHGGDDDIIVWGGVSLWTSLMTLDLIDELRIDLHPYIAGQGTRPFDGQKDHQFDLVSSRPFSNGVVGLQYQRTR
jgi:dihydrofolate reductase